MTSGSPFPLPGVSRRIRRRHPMPVSAALVQEPGFTKPFADLRQIHLAELLLRGERKFEGRALQMVDENFQVVGLNVGVLGGTPEKVIGMVHDELVQRCRRRDEYGARTPATPPCTAGSLPSGSDGARIAGHHASIERTNIDPQFECICGHDAAYPPFAQP